MELICKKGEVYDAASQLPYWAALEEHIDYYNKAVRKACNADKKPQITEQAKQLEEAADNRDYYQVWRCGRALAQTAFGPRRRGYRPPDGIPITHEQWDTYMTEMLDATPDDEPEYEHRFPAEEVFPMTVPKVSVFREAVLKSKKTIRRTSKVHSRQRCGK